MSLVGILAAGAAQGYGAAKNREVEEHNQLAVENMREMLRQEYEERRFNRQLEADTQKSKMQVEYENAKYHRDRSDKLSDEELKHEREIKKLGLLEGGRNSRSAASNAARLKAAEMRASSSGSSGSSDLSPKEMIKQIEANNKRIFDLKKELNNNPFAAQDPQKGELYRSEIGRLEADNARKQSALGIEPQQQAQPAAFDFVFNPKTGKLEPSR